MYKLSTIENGLEKRFASIVVCTRNRGDGIIPTIRSILASEHSTFELIIVDQSTDATTQAAVSSCGSDPRVRYLSTPTIGLSAARNIALQESSSNFVLMTDDDCEVSPKWVAVMIEKLLQGNRVALAFCDVVAGPCDDAQGFIPVSVATCDALIVGISNWLPVDGLNVGIGAGMALRRDLVLDLGGFDEALGAGAPFGSGEELDICVRALLSGYHIVRTTRTAVRHHGFRSHEQGKRHVRQAFYSVGALYGKCLRGYRFRVLLPLANVVWLTILKPIGWGVIRWRKPPVLGRFVNLIAGLAAGMTSAIDSRRLLFVLPQRSGRAGGSGHGHASARQ
jgi:glycosyltransferase involved in cell wall biosynthesis